MQKVEYTHIIFSHFQFSVLGHHTNIDYLFLDVPLSQLLFFTLSSLIVTGIKTPQSHFWTELPKKDLFFKFFVARCLLYNVVLVSTSTWISHRYTYVPLPPECPPMSHPLHPSRLSQSPGLSSFVTQQILEWRLLVYSIPACIYFSWADRYQCFHSLL